MKRPTVTLLLTAAFMLIMAGCNQPAESNTNGNNPGVNGESGNSSSARPTNPTVTLQQARAIAEADLVDRGINATFHSDSGMDYERGHGWSGWVWELEFRENNQNGRFVIEYYICVHTGAIRKFERERV